MRFNPPPNWPVPPSGWEPPQDWHPDPAWPPAPPGWVFWVDDGQSDDGGTLASVKTTTLRFLRVVNPMRLGYAAMTMFGIALFAWMFVDIRLTDQWNYEGWMWRGAWPVAAMLAGLALVAVGSTGAHRWSSARWVRSRHLRRAAAAQSV